MKSETLEVKHSNVAVIPQSVNLLSSDFPSVLFEHPQMRAISPKGFSNKEKLIALTAVELKEDYLHERDSRTTPGRMFRLAFLHRLFTNSVVAPPALATAEAPKHFWNDWSVSALLPIAGAMMLALAAWRTGETSSWKGVSDAMKAHVETLKDQLATAQADKKDLQQKNDALQNDLNALKTAADQKSDLTTLTDKINQLLKKYRNGAPAQMATIPSAATGQPVAH